MRKSTQRDVRWSLTADGEAEGALWTTVREMRNRQRPRRDMYLFWSQLFGVNEINGIGLTNYDASHAGFVPATLPFNLVRNGVKTIAAKVAKNKPLPLCMTSRGDYKQIKRARGISRYLEGAFHQLKVFETTPTIIRDALIFGTGILRVDRAPGADRPRIQREFPWECFVDMADGRYGCPRNFYVVKWRDRTELQAEHPDFADEIEAASANAGSIEDVIDYDDTSDVVLTIESWHLPPPKKGGGRDELIASEAEDPERAGYKGDGGNSTEVRLPAFADAQYGSFKHGSTEQAFAKREGIDRGRHVIAIDGTTLTDEPYHKDYFPFAFFRYDEPVIGFWGDSLAGELSGFQYEINYISETLHLGHRVVGTGIWLVPDGADVLDGHFQNDVGYILRYKQGFKPEYYNPEPVHQQAYDYLDFLTQRGLNFSGISQTSAQSQKPAGITAAKALQVLDEVEADRFALVEQANEKFHLDIADKLIDVMKEIADEYPDVAVKVPQRRAYLAVKWKDVDLDRDAFLMQTWPTALFARTPSARLQQVQDLFAAGIIDKTLFLKLLNAPDVDAETDLMAASQMLVDDQIESMMDSETPDAADAYKRPDEWSDLTYAVYRGAQQVALGTLQGVPDRNLDLLRNYVQDAKDLLDARTSAQQPAAPASDGSTPPGAPPGSPAPAPLAALQGSMQQAA